MWPHDYITWLQNNSLDIWNIVKQHDNVSVEVKWLLAIIFSISQGMIVSLAKARACWDIMQLRCHTNLMCPCLLLFQLQTVSYFKSMETSSYSNTIMIEAWFIFNRQLLTWLLLSQYLPTITQFCVWKPLAISLAWDCWLLWFAAVSLILLCGVF